MKEGVNRWSLTTPCPDGAPTSHRFRRFLIQKVGQLGRQRKRPARRQEGGHVILGLAATRFLTRQVGIPAISSGRQSRRGRIKNRAPPNGHAVLEAKSGSDRTSRDSGSEDFMAAPSIQPADERGADRASFPKESPWLKRTECRYRLLRSMRKGQMDGPQVLGSLRSSAGHRSHG